MDKIAPSDIRSLKDIGPDFRETCAGKNRSHTRVELPVKSIEASRGSAANAHGVRRIYTFCTARCR